MERVAVSLPVPWCRCGRVLVGVQVSEEWMESWNSFLKDLGYNYEVENDNLVYRQFLK